MTGEYVKSAVTCVTPRSVPPAPTRHQTIDYRGAVLFFAPNTSLPVNLFESPRLSSEAEESETLNVDGPITLKVVDEAGVKFN